MSDESNSFNMKDVPARAPTTLSASESARVISIIYKNHRGEVSQRKILPVRIWFGESAWHPSPQWLLRAFDLGKREDRDFAIRDIRSFDIEL